MNRVNFLGYMVENSTIRPSIEKTPAVENFPVPKKNDVSFTSYFRSFICGYAAIARPLSDLLRKNNDFVMAKAQMVAFRQFIERLMNAPVLKLYNPNAAIEVHTDVSMYGYGGEEYIQWIIK